MDYSLIQKQALGLDASALCEWRQGDKCFLIHKEIVDPLTRLQEDARQAGFNLQIVSAYRDFSRQLAIWNAKATGKRPLLDSEGNILAFDVLSNEEKLFAILRWSAIPGLSRHHWGTDFDIYDANQMHLEDVQLVPQEVEGSGPCAAMHDWLTGQIAHNQSYQFYRPYQFDSGGIAPEKWHLSYLPLAKSYAEQLKPGLLSNLWQEKQLLLLGELIANLTAIWPKYIELDASKQPEWVIKKLSESL
jgi:LAS superfamily LD-carboxypeptidase LdcB